MNTTTTLYRSRPSRRVRDCPQPETPLRPIVYVPQQVRAPHADNDDHPTPPAVAMQVAA